MAIRLTGRPLDAREAAAALDAAVAALPPAEAQPTSPTASSSAHSRGLRLPPTASPALTPPSASQGTPSGLAKCRGCRIVWNILVVENRERIRERATDRRHLTPHSHVSCPALPVVKQMTASIALMGPCLALNAAACPTYLSGCAARMSCSSLRCLSAESLIAHCPRTAATATTAAMALASLGLGVEPDAATAAALGDMELRKQVP